MEITFQTGTLLLLIAAVVAMLTRRLRLPYSVGLVVAGIALAALPFAPKVSLTKDLLFTVLLPPLLFQAAFYIPWNQLRRNSPVILVLATLGVVLLDVLPVVNRADIHKLEGVITLSAVLDAYGIDRNGSPEHQ
jgi:CPA1 family monovalent cation:H+ antiporter